MRRLEVIQKQLCFDPAHPESKPTTAQQEVINDFGIVRTQWIVAATQSGKSQTCSRLLTWMLTDTHPSWKRPEDWGEEPLLALVAGRTGRQIEESLIPKLVSYLDPGTWKLVKIGNITQRLELTNGNRIVFQSLENPSVARERIQSYVAHISWLDEMPPTAFIVDEMQRRVQARNGYFLGSFTPLVVNDEIKRAVDSAVLPYSKKYVFRMFDNPLYASEERRAEILSSMSHLPEAVRNTRLYGEWSTSDESVYYFDYDTMVAMPEGYSPMWRHVESVDPALKSALGLTLWAENPHNNKWYCILSEYVKGVLVPSELVKVVRAKTKNVNIVRRISDPHEVWYIQTAASMGLSYMGVYKKHERKSELIKQLQEKLGSVIILSPNCVDLITELQECRWSDRADGKIVNSSSFHLLDSAQYFCDSIPKPDNKIIAETWHDYLFQANEKRKVTKDRALEKIKGKIERASIRRRR